MKSIKLLCVGCDGALTDNRVWLDTHGVESVAFNRSDGLGIAMVKARGVEVCIVTSEGEPGDSATGYVGGHAGLRARKLGIRCLSGVIDKGEAVRELAEELCVQLEDVAFVGNDVNDLAALEVVGWPFVVADMHLSYVALINGGARSARGDGYISQCYSRGGHGAVREVCDLICEAKDG
jgi:N-acylneuraminate cytidylyltransferase